MKNNINPLYGALVAIVAFLCLTTIAIVWMYNDNIHKMYDKYGVQYLIDELLKNGQVEVKGECNIDNLNVPFNIAGNNTGLVSINLNGVSLGQLKCQFDAIVGKK